MDLYGFAVLETQIQGLFGGSEKALTRIRVAPSIGPKGILEVGSDIDPIQLLDLGQGSSLGEQNQVPTGNIVPIDRVGFLELRRRAQEPGSLAAGYRREIEGENVVGRVWREGASYPTGALELSSVPLLVVEREEVHMLALFDCEKSCHRTIETSTEQDESPVHGDA